MKWLFILIKSWLVLVMFLLIGWFKIDFIFMIDVKDIRCSCKWVDDCYDKFKFVDRYCVSYFVG